MVCTSSSSITFDEYSGDVLLLLIVNVSVTAVLVCVHHVEHSGTEYAYTWSTDRALLTAVKRSVRRIACEKHFLHMLPYHLIATAFRSSSIYALTMDC
jgi:hypothetical protein